MFYLPTLTNTPYNELQVLAQFYKSEDKLVTIWKTQQSI